VFNVYNVLLAARGVQLQRSSQCGRADDGCELSVPRSFFLISHPRRSGVICGARAHAADNDYDNIINLVLLSLGIVHNIIVVVILRNETVSENEKWKYYSIILLTKSTTTIKPTTNKNWALTNDREQTAEALDCGTGTSYHSITSYGRYYIMIIHHRRQPCPMTTPLVPQPQLQLPIVITTL